LIVLLPLAVLSIPVVKSVRRRLSLSRAKGPRELVLAAYRGLAWESADVGLARRPSETLREYHARLKERVSNGDLDQLFGLTGRAVYSDREIPDEPARRAAQAASEAAREIKGSVGLPRRVAGTFRVARLTRLGRA
jgi:hypothetical protein